MKPKQEEHDKCVLLMEWAELNLKRYPFLKLLYHIPNEGKRDPRYVFGMGFKSGIPDYHLPIPCYSKGISGFWLEMKATGKKPTKEQLRCHAELTEYRHMVVWTDSLQVAIDSLTSYCKLVMSDVGSQYLLGLATKGQWSNRATLIGGQK